MIYRRAIKHIFCAYIACCMMLLTIPLIKYVMDISERMYWAFTKPQNIPVIQVDGNNFNNIVDCSGCDCGFLCSIRNLPSDIATVLIFSAPFLLLYFYHFYLFKKKEWKITYLLPIVPILMMINCCILLLGSILLGADYSSRPFLEWAKGPVTYIGMGIIFSVYHLFLLKAYEALADKLTIISNRG